MKDRAYSYLYGSGDTNEDVEGVIAKHGKPNNVFYESNGYAAALVYDDKVVCTGYDGCEYRVNFMMDDKESNNNDSKFDYHKVTINKMEVKTESNKTIIKIKEGDQNESAGK